MKDSTSYILSELYRLLNETVTVDGQPVKYYSVAVNPNDNEQIYIKTAAGNSFKNRNKTSSVRYETILIDCVTYNPNGAVNEEAVSELCAKVVSAIIPSPNSTNIQNSVDFHIVDVNDESIRTFQDKLNEGWKLRKQIELQITINDK